MPNVKFAALGLSAVLMLGLGLPVRAQEMPFVPPPAATVTPPPAMSAPAAPVVLQPAPKPAEIKPAETKPADSKPAPQADAKTAEPKAADKKDKPVDKKPAVKSEKKEPVKPAAKPAAAGAPDPKNNKALASLMQMGAKLYYLGRYDGMDGWLALKDGQVQFVYKAVKSDYTIVGVLFSPEGDNITVMQLRKLVAGNKELAKLVSDATHEENADTAASTAATTASKTNTEAALMSESQDDMMLPAGERLMKLLKNGPAAAMETKTDAPLLYVLITPSSPNCKQLWQSLSPLVKSGAVRARLLPAGLKNSEDERVAAKLLQAADPVHAWDQYVAGDVKVMAGKPTAASIAKVQAIATLINNWKFPTAPYTLYRDHGGKVKVVQGLPADVNALLADAAPETGAP